MRISCPCKRTAQKCLYLYIGHPNKMFRFRSLSLSSRNRMPVKAGLLTTKAWLRGVTIGVNKTRSCACKVKYLLRISTSDSEFFFFHFSKNMGRSVGRWHGKRNMLWGWPYRKNKNSFLIFFLISRLKRSCSPFQNKRSPTGWKFNCQPKALFINIITSSSSG